MEQGRLCCVQPGRGERGRAETQARHPGAFHRRHGKHDRSRRVGVRVFKARDNAAPCAAAPITAWGAIGQDLRPEALYRERTGQTEEGLFPALRAEARSGRSFGVSVRLPLAEQGTPPFQAQHGGDPDSGYYDLRRPCMARGRLAAHAAYWLGHNNAKRSGRRLGCAPRRRARFAVSLTRTSADDAQPIAFIREPPNKVPAKDRPPTPRDARTHVSRENALPAREPEVPRRPPHGGIAPKRDALACLLRPICGQRRLLPSFREAGGWIARTGSPGRPWPAEYGQEHAVDHRYAARRDRGLGARRMQSAQDDPDLSATRLDSPIARAPQNVSGELPLAHGMPIATEAGSRLRAQAQGGTSAEEGAWLWTRGIPFVVIRHLPTRFGLLAGVPLRLGFGLRLVRGSVRASSFFARASFFDVRCSSPSTQRVPSTTLGHPCSACTLMEA